MLCVSISYSVYLERKLEAIEPCIINHNFSEEVEIKLPGIYVISAICPFEVKKVRNK
jgi:hypothetical protein